MSHSNINPSGCYQTSPSLTDGYSTEGEGSSRAIRKRGKDKTDSRGIVGSIWQVLRLVREAFESQEMRDVDDTETYDIPEEAVSFSWEQAVSGDIPSVSVSKEAVEKLERSGLSEKAEFILDKVSELFRQKTDVCLYCSSDPELPDYEHFVVHLKASMEPEEVVRQKRKLKAQLRESYVNQDLESFVFTYQI